MGLQNKYVVGLAMLAAIMTIVGLPIIAYGDTNSKTKREEILPLEIGEVDLLAPEDIANVMLPTDEQEEPFWDERVESEDTYDIEAVTGNVSIDSAHFPDKIFREYVKQFDLDCNGYLSDDEYMYVSEISVSNMGISSLKGIEYFDNLLWLYADGNKLKSLNLDNNIVLEKLHVQNNPIKKLDITECLMLGQMTLQELTVSSGKASWQGDLIIPASTTLTYNGMVLYRAGKPKSVSLNDNKLSMKPGKQQALVATPYPQGVATTFKWSSSNKKVVTVDARGVIKAKAKGTATITVKTANGKKATCKVTVKKTESGIELSGYYGKDIHQAAREIGGLKYQEWGPEDGIKEYYENKDIILSGWDDVMIITLLRKSNYKLFGIKVGMRRSTIREKMKGYKLTGDDDRYGAQYILRGSSIENAELLLGVTYDDDGYAEKVEYGIWS